MRKENKGHDRVVKGKDPATRVVNIKGKAEIAFRGRAEGRAVVTGKLLETMGTRNKKAREILKDR